MPKLLKALSVSLCLLLLITACSDNPSASNEEPPELPPAQSMQADFTMFEQQQKTAQLQTQASDNFTRALGTAVVMKAVVDINLAIPRALLTAAANTEASLNEKEEWEWNYSKNADGQTYSVRLVASRDGSSDVNWNFYVTNTAAGISDQLFFSGTTSADGRQGTWSYYDLQSLDAEEQVSEITWSIKGDEEVSLRLDVTSDRNENNGDFLEYKAENNIKSAAYYNADEDETTQLEWNAETKAGFIISHDYNEGQKACWDTNFQDIACN